MVVKGPPWVRRCGPTLRVGASAGAGVQACPDQGSDPVSRLLLAMLCPLRTQKETHGPFATGERPGCAERASAGRTLPTNPSSDRQPAKYDAEIRVFLARRQVKNTTNPCVAPAPRLLDGLLRPSFQRAGARELGRIEDEAGRDVPLASVVTVIEDQMTAQAEFARERMRGLQAEMAYCRMKVWEQRTASVSVAPAVVRRTHGERRPSTVRRSTRSSTRGAPTT